MLGLPLYGRTFLLVNPENNKIGDEAKGVSFKVK